MNYETDLKLIVNDVEWVLPGYEGYTVIKRKLNAYAERTPKTMRIDQLGDVWEINVKIPAGLVEAEYKRIADSLSPFIINVQYYNPWTGARRTDRFYHTDLEVTRIWRGIHGAFEVTFIGTEVL